MAKPPVGKGCCVGCAGVGVWEARWRGALVVRACGAWV